MSAESSVDLIADVLAVHTVSTDWFRRRNGFAWWCSCHVDGEGVHPSGDGARSAAARHQAEQVAEAIRDAGYELSGWAQAAREAQT